MRTKSQKEAQKRYVKRHYRLEVLLPMDAKEKLRNHAESMNMSVAAFTNRALQLTIKNDIKAREQKEQEMQEPIQNNNQQMRMHKPSKKTNT